MELLCTIQKYEWGKRGMQSKVCQLHKSSNAEFEVEEKTPYAELWMGTHPNGTSILKTTGESLKAFVLSNPAVLGEKVLDAFGVNLPFLFKVLSVKKALSIQAHPTKEDAQRLHSERPDLYKDPNHKPEMCIALTPFEALCGFRPYLEIKAFMSEIPELKDLIKDENVRHFVGASCGEAHSALKVCFRALMMADKQQVACCLKALLSRLSKEDENTRQKYLAPLLERLNAEYPDDVGCFAIYLFNYVLLKPLEALFLGANEPHAYLSGDCVECMACSDNVVRAGLTPKFKDVETLCSMLNYKGETAEDKKLKPVQESNYSLLYKPPVWDFAVSKVEMPRDVSSVSLKQRPSASIIIVISGTAKMNHLNVGPGSVLFLPAHHTVCISEITPHFLMFQAMANF